MEIAVLSDIHGNYIALQTCMEYALKKRIHTFFFLGDYVGELAYPQRTMKLLMQIKQQYECYFVRGNKEDYWLTYRKNQEWKWKEYDSVTGSLLYTYNCLTDEDIHFFESLSHVQEIVIEDLPTLTICHGSPNRTNEKLLPGNEKTLEIMEKSPTSYILCGHTHIQGKIMHQGKAVLNAGSVGVSLNSNGKAQFMILHGEDGSWREEFISMDYDVEKVIEELHESGLDVKAPCLCKVTEHMLRTGNISHGSVLARAMELFSIETGKCNWPDVPEKYMEQAVREMLG